MQIARQVALEPFSNALVMVSPPVTELSYLEPTHRGNRAPYLYTAPGEVELTRSQAFNMLVSSFHSKHVQLLKSMVVTHCTDPPLLIVDLTQPARERQLATEEPLLSDGSLIVSVHYKPAKVLEVEVTDIRLWNLKADKV